MHYLLYACTLNLRTNIQTQNSTNDQPVLNFLPGKYPKLDLFFADKYRSVTVQGFPDAEIEVSNIRRLNSAWVVEEVKEVK